MTDVQLMIASAVILPEPLEQALSSTAPSTPRQSSSSTGRDKRARLEDDETVTNVNLGPSGQVADLSTSTRQVNGRLEERKRGKRLFGALLGTLAQSSSSTAHARRLSIEHKQQAKLKLQAEEDDEKKKHRLEVLMGIRRQEQQKYSKQSLQIRHSNLLAMSRFLRTKAAPSLYYMPWELLPGDEARIESQVEEAEAIVGKETSTFGEPPTEVATTNVAIFDDVTERSNLDADDCLETMGLESSKKRPNDAAKLVTTAEQHALASCSRNQARRSSESSKDLADDGGEVMVEGDEDTVIY